MTVTLSRWVACKWCIPVCAHTRTNVAAYVCASTTMLLGLFALRRLFTINRLCMCWCNMEFFSHIMMEYVTKCSVHITYTHADLVSKRRGGQTGLPSHAIRVNTTALHSLRFYQTVRFVSEFSSTLAFTVEGLHSPQLSEIQNIINNHWLCFNSNVSFTSTINLEQKTRDFFKPQISLVNVEITIPGNDHILTTVIIHNCANSHTLLQIEGGSISSIFITILIYLLNQVNHNLKRK